jgi:integrase
MTTRKKQFEARIYIGNGQYKWIGRYPTKREANHAKAEALIAHKAGRTDAGSMTVQAFADRFLHDYQRDHKESSYMTAASQLQPFLREFGGRDLRSLTRTEAKDWARDAKQSWLPTVVTLLNVAVEDDLLEKNPFRGLARRSPGRGELAPPSEEDVERLLEACSVLGSEYGPRFRAFVVFAMHSGLRPGELFALDWTDIDMHGMRVNVARRLYRGSFDVPKSGKPRPVALTPPARDALLGLPRVAGFVFGQKSGRRMNQGALSRYWGLVQARAGTSFDFYLASRHFCAHYMWVVLGLPERAVVAQLGHVDGKLLKSVYGHGEVGALSEIDRAYERAAVVPLRAVKEEGA